MKKLIYIICLLALCTNAFSQTDGNDTARYIWSKFQYGSRMPRFWADSVLNLPKDTLYSKSGLSRIGTSLFIGNGIFWTAVGSGTGAPTKVYVKRPLTVDSTTNPGFQTLGEQLKDGLISGGIVTSAGGFNIDISSADYGLKGQEYITASTTLTATASDPSLPRKDIVVVDTLGHVSILPGTPNANPQKPQPNPASQLELTFFDVPAGATALNFIVDTIYSEGIVPPNWDTATAGTITARFRSTVNPHTGTHTIRVSKYTDNSGLIFTDAGLDTVTSDMVVKFWIYLPSPTTNRFRLQLFNGSISTSNLTDITPFLNPLDTGVYQMVAIPQSYLGVTNNVFNRKVLSMSGYDTTGVNGFYLDDITLQKGISNNLPSLYLTTDSTGAATLVGNHLNIPTNSGGGTPAGTTQDIQFNTAGAFDADSNFKYDKDSSIFKLGNNALWSQGATIRAGLNTTDGTPAGLDLIATDAIPGSVAQGGYVNIHGSKGDGTSAGGAASVIGGDGGDGGGLGGQVSITGGNGGALGNGGTVNIYGGSHTDGAYHDGSVNLSSGNTVNIGTGNSQQISINNAYFLPVVPGTTGQIIKATDNFGTTAWSTIAGSGVDSIYRTTGKDSIQYKISGRYHAIKDSVGLTSIDTTNISNFSQKVRSLFSGTSPITFNSGNGAIAIIAMDATHAGYVPAGGSAGKVLHGDGTWKDTTAASGSSLTRQVITSGTTATVTGGNYVVDIDPSSTIASFTLTLPASPTDLQTVNVEFGGTLTSGTIVTALTISPNSGQTIIDNTPPGNAMADNVLLYRYRASNTTWYRYKF